MKKPQLNRILLNIPLLFHGKKKDSNYSLLSLILGDLHLSTSSVLIRSINAYFKSSKYKVNAFSMQVPYNAILIRDVLIIQQIELCSYFPGKLFIKILS